MIKYSVIIPAYDCADTLEVTVKSVLASGLTDFEVIIINDGSTDGTKSICDKLSERYDEVIAYHQKNSGVSTARNLGIEKARGRYILFMDSDDSYDEGALSHAKEIVEEKEPDILIFGLRFDYYKNDEIYRSDELVYPHEGLFSPMKWGEEFHLMFEKNALSSACNKFFKTSIIKENKLSFNKDIFIMEDFLFVLDCLNFTNDIYMLPQAIYRYRQPDEEDRAFKRMARVENLNVYLTPFYNSIENLKKRFLEKYNTDFPQGEKTALNLYFILLHQKAYYADLKTLKDLSADHKESKWIDCEDTYPLLSDFRNDKALKIYINNKKTQLRHKIAVKLKKARII